MNLKDYEAFIARKVRKVPTCGFEPDILNGHLFDWQKLIVARSVRLGRSAMFEECGLGKTLQQLEWALRLWSNPGDTIFSPFAGIGSEGYCAVKMGRKFVGAELKKSYFDVACANLSKAWEESRDLFQLTTDHQQPTAAL